MYSNFAMVHRLVVLLGRKFCLNQNQNYRKGGLIGLAAVMVGFKNGTSSEPSPAMIEEAIRPLLTCLLDSDPRMRYHACESLFNVTKVAKGAILAQFQSIFDCLSKIVCDPNPDVRIGAEALDRLLKDIVVEQPELDMKDFIGRLDEYIYTKNPFTRMFIISWIRLLDTKLNMITYLPHLLDGIFNCLYDTTEEIRASTLVLLSEFLNKMVTLPTDTSNLASLMNTLLKHAKNEREDPVQFTAVSWLRQFIRLMDDQDLITYTPGILSAILPCLAMQVPNESNSSNPLLHMTQRYAPQTSNQGNICEISNLVNSSLLEHVTTVIVERRNSSDSEPIINDLELVLEVLTTELQKHEHPVIKLAIFDWLKALKKAEPCLIIASVWQHKLFQALLGTLSDRSDAVVKHSLRVIADVFCDEQDNEQQSVLNSIEDNLNISKEDESLVETSDKKKSLLRSPQSTLQKSPINKKVALSTGADPTSVATPHSSQSQPNISRFIQALYKTFRDNERVFEERATFIVFNLCSMIKACIVYRLFAEILKDEKSDLRFAYNLVQKLNHILLTSQPLFSLRSRLCNDDEPEMAALFQTIYLAWCHSPMAAFTLCLAANNFRPANEIVHALAQSDINTEILKQIDSVVDLIESPAFSSLRIRLLDLSSNQYLIQSLYGLLMILPQSQAYNKLSHRLDQAHKFMCAQPHFRTGATSGGTGNVGKQTVAPTSLGSSTSASNVRESSKKAAIGSTSLDAMVKHYNSIQNLHSKLSRAAADPED